MNGTPLRRIHEDGKEKLLKGIDDLAVTVASTLGAAGRTVILEDPATSLPYVTKDGVTVAEYINPVHPVENLGAALVREASKKTANEAGDGTTTSTVLTKAILDIAVPQTGKSNFRQVIKKINLAKDVVLKDLDEMSTKVTKDNLKDIATISANNDSVIGGLIAEAYDKVGLEGSVLVANSETADTFIETSDGSSIQSGYTTHHFANQQDGKWITKNPYILLLDQEVDNIWKLEGVVEHCAKERKPLLIVGKLSPQATGTLAMNVKKGIIQACIVEPSMHGKLKSDLLSDIALLTGATVVGEEYGTSLDTVTFRELGTLPKVTVTSMETIFNFPKKDIKDHIAEINEAIKDANQFEIGGLKYRLHLLTGKVATIRVGALTETALKELKDRVDDSIHATKCALQEGILPGGGVALKDIANKHKSYGLADTSDNILYEALLSPLTTILDNGGFNIEDFGGTKTIGVGVNVLTGKEVDVKKAGIIDPTKVTKNAVMNAVEVATTVLSTDYIVTNVRNDELKELLNENN